MAGPKRIGFYLSENKFFIVESADNNLLRVITSVPYFAEEQSSTGDIRLIALIQRTIREHNISQSEVRFSIPTSDVIIRSFLIPPMNAAELNPVVDFELKKHIPFDLKDFSYTFNALNVVENKIKKMRVLVAAIRRTVLTRYEQVLSQSKLNAIVCEPASFGLVRVLYAKKVVAGNIRFALIHINQGNGRIIFVQDGMALFIREFNLLQQGVSAEISDEEHIVKARFVNEVQNSLDFFTRAHEQVPISQIIIIQHDDARKYEQWLTDEVNIPKKTIEAKSLIGSQVSGDQTGILFAFGVSLADPRSSTIFNLSSRAPKRSTVGQLDIKEYDIAMKAGAMALVLLGCLFAFFSYKMSDLQKTKDTLSAQQGEFADLSTEEIQTKVDKIDGKLKQYQALDVKTKVTDIFVRLSQDVPQGLWLTSLDIRSGKTKETVGNVVLTRTDWDITFNAYVFHGDSNQEIRIVNDFISRLKKDKDLERYVKNVNLQSMSQQDQGGYKVISISVKCT